MYDLANYQAPMASFNTPQQFDNPYEQARRAEMQRQLQEYQQQQQQQEQQQQQVLNQYNDLAMDYLKGMGGGTEAASTMGALPGMSSSAAVNAAGGTLQSSMAAPLAQSSALGTGGLGGGSVVGPMSAAPTAGMSTAGTTAGTTLGGTTAGGGAGGGAAAGGGALAAAAPWLAIPAAVGAVGHMENNAGVNTWRQQLTDPGGSASRRADYIEDKSKDWFGDNKFGEGVGDVMGGLNQVVMPSSFGDWWDGTKKIHGWDKIGGELQNFGSSVADLFSGWF